MRKFLGCCSILLLVSCLDETRVDPATPSTFVRYINGGNHDYAMALEKTSDKGFIILANSQLKISDKNKVSDKIKLVKVNAYGSVLWSKVYPKNADPAVSASFLGTGIFVSDEGYIISGETIQGNGKKQLLIVEVDGEGEEKAHYTLNLPSATVQDGVGPVTGDVGGVAVTKSGDNLLVLASLGFDDEVGITENMILAKVNPLTSPPSVIWDYRYGDGESALVNQLFLDGNDVIFGGTITTNSKSDLRLIKVPQNSQGTTFNLPFGDPDRDERANNICSTASGFAMVGSTDVAGKTDRDILFMRFSATGQLLIDPKTYPIYIPGTDTDVGKDEEGNDVCNTKDSGYIILATIVSAEGDVLGRGEQDYYLIKVNAFGTKEWERAYGSKREDLGIAVTQADDGGYVILGRTNLANLWTIALIKTNSKGEIE